MSVLLKLLTCCYYLLAQTGAPQQSEMQAPIFGVPETTPEKKVGFFCYGVSWYLLLALPLLKLHCPISGEL